LVEFSKKDLELFMLVAYPAEVTASAREEIRKISAKVEYAITTS